MSSESCNLMSSESCNLISKDSSSVPGLWLTGVGASDFHYELSPIIDVNECGCSPKSNGGTWHNGSSRDNGPSWNYGSSWNHGSAWNYGSSWGYGPTRNDGPSWGLGTTWNYGPPWANKTSRVSCSTRILCPSCSCSTSEFLDACSSGSSSTSSTPCDGCGAPESGTRRLGSGKTLDVQSWKCSLYSSLSVGETASPGVP